jgi:hypothetical protein
MYNVYNVFVFSAQMNREVHMALTQPQKELKTIFNNINRNFIEPAFQSSQALGNVSSETFDDAVTVSAVLRASIV